MKKIILLVGLSLFVSCFEQKKEENGQPNIVFIFADDLTYSAINALGNKEIQTPKPLKIFPPPYLFDLSGQN